MSQWRWLDEAVLRISGDEYNLPVAEEHPDYAEAVLERVRAILREKGSPSRDYVGRRGNGDQLALHRDGDFWIVSYWERGRGNDPAAFWSFYDAVRYFLYRTVGSDEMNWRDLPERHTLPAHEGQR